MRNFLSHVFTKKFDQTYDENLFQFISATDNQPSAKRKFIKIKLGNNYLRFLNRIIDLCSCSTNNKKTILIKSEDNFYDSLEYGIRVS